MAITKYAGSLSETTILKTQEAVCKLKDRQDTLENSLKFFMSKEHDLYQKEVNTHIASIQHQMAELDVQLSQHQQLLPMGAVQDQEQVVDEVIVLNTWLLTQFQLSKALNKEEQEMLAVTIAFNFRAYSIDELLLVYKNAIAGKYGQVYNRIDSAVICGWLSSYKKEKTNAIYSKQQSRYASNSTATREPVKEDAAYVRAKEAFIQKRSPLAPNEGTKKTEKQ